MSELKFVLWNCSGLRATTDSTAHKMGFFDMEMPNANFSIAVFLETHHKKEEDFPFLISEYKTTHNILHTPTPYDHTHSGVIVLIRKDLEIISHNIAIPGRLLNFHFRDKVENKVFNCSAFYGPQIYRIPSRELSNFFEPFFECHSKDDNNIILGDFKRKVGIVDAFREQFPTTKKFSFFTRNGKSRIDRVYINSVNAYNIANISVNPSQK